MQKGLLISLEKKEMSFINGGGETWFWRAGQYVNGFVRGLFGLEPGCTCS